MAKEGCSFIVKNENGGCLLVDEVRSIPLKRRFCEGSKGAAVTGMVMDGKFSDGDDVTITNGIGEVLGKDKVGRLEVNRIHRAQVTRGVNAGMLLMNHPVKSLMELGIPVHRSPNADQHP